MKFIFCLFFFPFYLFSLPNNAMRVEEGLSNENYIEWHEGKKVFVKYKPDKIHVLGTSWEREVLASRFVERLGLAPSLLWSDKTKHSLAFQYLNDAIPFSKSESDIALLCEKLHQLHDQKPFGLPFDPYKQMRQELDLFKEKGACPHWVDAVSKQYEKLEKHREEFVWQERPCHLDLWSPNILVTTEAQKPRLWLIDWEFAGDTDPDYDLAIFFVLDDATQEFQDRFLKSYGRSLDPAFQRRFAYIHSVAALRSAIWFATRSVICDGTRLHRFGTEYFELSCALLQKMESL